MGLAADCLARGGHVACQKSPRGYFRIAPSTAIARVFFSRRDDSMTSAEGGCFFFVLLSLRRGETVLAERHTQTMKINDAEAFLERELLPVVTGSSWQLSSSPRPHVSN